MLVLLGSYGFGAAIAISFVNQVVLQGTTGASVGKYVTRIRVIRALDGGRPGFYTALGRWLLLPIDVVVGLIVMMRSDDHRRVGDIASETCVVDVAAAGVAPHEND